jgi:hypothetical protein
VADAADWPETDERTRRRELLATPVEGVFVGREHEMAQLLAGLNEAEAGRGRLFLVAGEPGIGKSRIAEELSTEARRRDARVLWGRCWEAGGAPAYWPWVQSLRGYVREADADEVRKQLGQGASDVAQILPEVREQVPNATEVATTDPEVARFQLFDSTAAFVRNISRDRTLVLILEDIHAADTPSLVLLEFLATSSADMSVMILATYRDVEVGRGHPLASAVIEMARAPTTRRIHLSGLTPPDVGLLIHATTGVTPRQDLVDALSQETEGNPLFVGEIVRLLASQGRLSTPTAASIKPIPRGVREVIGRRLGQASEPCNHVLGIASVLGREFRIDVLVELSERPGEELLEILDEARAAWLVADVPGTLSSMRFSHSLIRDTLYEELPAGARIRLHQRAGETLERIWGARTEHLAELAHHFLAAAPAGHPHKAIDYAIRAADAAKAGLAFEEAARLYRLALQAIEVGNVAHDRLRLTVLLALGDALNRAGDAEAARLEFLEAAGIARRLHDAESLARAALGYGGRFAWTVLRGDANITPLLEEALAGLGDVHTTLRVMCMGRLAAGPMRDNPDATQRQALSREALEIARELGDPATLGYAIEARMGAVMSPDSRGEMLALCDELQELALGMGDGDRLIEAHQMRLVVRLLEGRMREVTVEREQMALVAEKLRQRAQTWYLLANDAELAMLAGRFDEAVRLSTQAYEAGRRAEPYAPFAHLLMRLLIRIEQGRVEEMRAEFFDSTERFRLYPQWRGALPYLLFAFARFDQALAALKAATKAPRPVNEDWLLGEGLLADAAASLGERDVAAELFAELEPYADLTIGGIPNANVGSLHRPLGRLAALLRRGDDAERHLRAAIEINDEMGALPWAARARYDYALLLVSRNAPGDDRAAAAYLSDAIEAAEKLGMRQLVEEAQAQQRACALPATERDSAESAGLGPSSEPSDGRFKLEGEYWTIGYEGHVLRLKDSKGLRILAVLLGKPGQPHASLDLERLGENDHDELARAVASGNAGELIDDEARSAYRVRLVELQDAIDEAESWGRAEQAGALRDEKDFITHELARALGLGGRSRKAGSVAERARLNVTRAVKSAMQRIAEVDGNLAAHLQATVRTGAVCAYVPDPRSAVRWRV